MILLALIATIGAHGPKTTTMLGTDAALECPFTSGSVCETAAGPDVTVTTTRASTRMCFTGTAWQTVGVDTPCIGVWGLASFGAGTNYAANSADFSKATWSKGGAATVAEVAGGYRVTMPNVGSNIASELQTVANGETWTVSCYVRNTGSTTGIVIRPFTASTPGVSACAVTATPDWSRVSCTNTASGAGSAAAIIYANTAGTSIDVQQCQLEKSPTTGPRHDCEAAPCSWQADVHTVSTAGWPVEAGEIRLRWTPAEATSADARFLLTAENFGIAGWALYVRANTDGLAFLVGQGTGTSYLHPGSPISWVAGRTYDIRVVWGGGRVRAWVDGAQVIDTTGGQMPLGPLPATGYVGRRNSGATGLANGCIRLLVVRR